MALVVNDRVKETSTTTGTGTFDLAGAATGFQTFVAGVGDTNTTYYAIFNQGTTEWEVGLGTVTDAATDTLARTTVISSSNSGSAVDFASGTKDVFCTLPASKTVFGKQEGTNFTDSLLVGHTTTGTLSSALRNTAVGLDSMQSITSADDNVIVGYIAGRDITTGSSNVAVGAYALRDGVGTDNNVAIGKNSMKDCGTGADNNTGVGQAALEQVSGNYNIAIGRQAADNLTTGAGNIIIGTADAAAADSARTFKVISYDGSSTTNHIISDSSGNMIFAGTANAAGGQLTTTGKAFVMGF